MKKLGAKFLPAVPLMLISTMMTGLSIPSFAESHGLTEIVCEKQFSGYYKVEINDGSVHLLDRGYGDEALMHAFDINHCSFKPFAIELECDQEDGTKMDISVKKEIDRDGMTYHVVSFKFAGLPLSDYDFDTWRIMPQSKRHTCKINGTYEVL